MKELQRRMRAYRTNGDEKMKGEKAKKPQNNASQLRAFRKASRELGCEPNEKQFQDALRTIAKAKPSDKQEAKRDRNRDK
jgi:hypothetical protein